VASKKTILIVEDEEDIQELIQFNLKKEGYSIISAYDGEKAIDLAHKEKPNLVLLDLMLPGLDGLEVCRNLKQNNSTRNIPVIMLTAKTEDMDMVTGLELGADDYITKPFSPRILIARIRAVLRRSEDTSNNEPSPASLKIHGISIDTARHEIIINDNPLELSVTEFAILQFLAQNPGWVFSRNQIINAIKGSDYPVTERSVDVQILGLRKKLGALGHIIQTVRGIGYRMKEEEV